MNKTIGGELVEMADFLSFDHPKSNGVMEDMRQRLVKAGFGVTIQGPYATLRFNDCEVTMIVTRMTNWNERTPVETPQ